MLLLLPPSEGKAAAPRRARPLALDTLAFPELTATRAAVLDALGSLCADEVKAREILRLPPGLAAEVRRNRTLTTTPTLPAGQLYTGVLYGALGLATLDPAARRRANRSLVVVSALWGAVRPTDRIPPYRLSMDVTLPGIGPLAAAWRQPLSRVLPALAGRGMIVDLRSATYAAAWRPAADLTARTVAVRILREEHGVRSVVSHLAKHTRGEVARHLLEHGADLRTPQALARVVGARWPVELTVPAQSGRPARLDVVLPG